MRNRRALVVVSVQLAEQACERLVVRLRGQLDAQLVHVAANVRAYREPPSREFRLQSEPHAGGDAGQRKVSPQSCCDRSADSRDSLEWPNFSSYPVAKRILRHVHIIPALQVQPVARALPEVTPQP